MRGEFSRGDGTGRASLAYPPGKADAARIGCPTTRRSRKLMDGSGLRAACPTTPPENLRGLRRSEGTVVQRGMPQTPALRPVTGKTASPQLLRKLRRK